MKQIGILFLSILIISISGCGRKKKDAPFVYFRNYQRTFNDMNDKHLKAAKQWGCEPLASEDEVKSRKGKLTEIKSNRYYEVEPLTHSLPYLVPRAAGLLKTIGNNFQDSLKSKGLPACKIIVTSVLRTHGSVKNLRQKNLNASANSAHIYGTTVDIAYSRYKNGKAEDRDKLKTVLAEVLQDLRKAQKCYVRYEFKQGCFHITVR